jgi:crossover junction endodeoxyribonuclease RusA
MRKRLAAAFTIEGAPVTKERPRVGQHGNTYTPRATKEGEEKIAWAFRASVTRARTSHGFPMMKPSRLRLEVDAYLANARTKDWDNIGKAVSDALNQIAYVDDSQIKQAEVRLELDPQRPRTEVRLYLLEEEAA